MGEHTNTSQKAANVHSGNLSRCYFDHLVPTAPGKDEIPLVARSNQSAAQAFAGALTRHGIDTVFGQ
ncbi:MAG TPA: hypothetical protein VGF43_07905, partial [Dongiaceae bacterium]